MKLLIINIMAKLVLIPLLLQFALCRNLQSIIVTDITQNQSSNVVTVQISSDLSSKNMKGVQSIKNIQQKQSQAAESEVALTSNNNEEGQNNVKIEQTVTKISAELDNSQRQTSGLETKQKIEQPTKNDRNIPQNSSPAQLPPTSQTSTATQQILTVGQILQQSPSSKQQKMEQIQNKISEVAHKNENITNKNNTVTNDAKPEIQTNDVISASASIQSQSNQNIVNGVNGVNLENVNRSIIQINTGNKEDVSLLGTTIGNADTSTPSNISQMVNKQSTNVIQSASTTNTTQSNITLQSTDNKQVNQFNTNVSNTNVTVQHNNSIENNVTVSNVSLNISDFVAFPTNQTGLFIPNTTKDGAIPSPNTNLTQLNNVTTPPVNVPTPPANVTTPPANVTTPPANVTTPPANVTTPPANVTTPPANVTTPPANVTTPPVNVTTPPANVTTPPANVTTPPANVTTPPANVTTPPANVTTPPANVTTPPANVTTPPANVTTPPANVTTPPANVTTPPANVTTPPANVTTPPANVTTPPANVTTPPANVTTPPANVTNLPSSGIITITFSKDSSTPTNFVITNSINNSSTSFTNNATQQPPIMSQNTTSTNNTPQVSPTMVSLVNVLNSTITLPTTSPNITIPIKLKEERPQKIIGVTRFQDSGFSDDLIPVGLQNDPRFRKLKNIIVPTTVNLQILQLKKFKRSFDGTNNNIANPKWGSTNTPQKRHCGVNYADGRSIPISGLPSPRQTSDAVGAIRKNPQMNKQNVTLAWTIWGQFIDHDMEHSQSSDNEVFHIPIPRCDKFLDSDCNGTRVIPFTRSLFSTDSRGVRTPLNALTAWIDASMVYGTSLQQSNKLRSFSQGKLKTDSSGRMLPEGKRVQINPSDILRNVTNTNISNLTMEAGDSRSNQNLVLLSYQTLFLREHNRICDLFIRNNLGLSDQDAFNIARNYVIGLIQKITYEDYLPALLGSKAYKQFIGPYPGYDDKLDPTIQIEFSAAGFRFGHSIVPLGFPLVNIYGDKLQFLDMDRAFFRPDLLNTVSLDRIFRGIARTVTKLRDGQFVDQLRNLLILAPEIRNIRMDLLAINIQRGRDQGIPAFNTLRECYGFRRFFDFNQFSDNKTKNEQLSKVYRNINNVDSYISIQLEKGVQGSVLGETGIAIVGKQFQKLRNADRFWYEKVLPPKILAEIKATKLSEIILRNTAITELQQDIFHYHFGL